MKTVSKTPKPKATKKAKVMNHLKNGKSLTKKQANALYGVKNLRATVSDIRQNEFSVKTIVNKTGEVAYTKA